MFFDSLFSDILFVSFQRIELQNHLHCSGVKIRNNTKAQNEMKCIQKGIPENDCRVGWLHSMFNKK